MLLKPYSDMIQAIAPAEACVSSNMLIIQVCVPDYRVGLFSAVYGRFKALTVATGPEYFSPTVRDAAAGEVWAVSRSNAFFLGRRISWLGSHWRMIRNRTLVIHEWNPRILSLWRDLIVCRFNGIPFVLWGHAWGNDGPRGIMFWLRHWVARRANGIMCYTESQAKLTRSLNPSVPVISAPNACLRRSDCGVGGIESGRDAVIYVGRLVNKKKVGLLIEGFARACQRGINEFRAKLVIVGAGPARTMLEERARELGIAERVSWLGHEANPQVLRTIYGQAFVSVSPGYVGLSLTQSFAFGVPALIARDEPHSPEIEAAKEGVNARFFTSDNPDDLASKLQGAWSEWRGIESERKKLSAWTADNYSFEKMAERFCEMAELVSDPAKSRGPSRTI